MAMSLRVLGGIGIFLGLVLLAAGFEPLTDGRPFAVFSSYLVTQAGVAITAGLIALGLGQLIAINERLSQNIEDLLDLMRPQEAETAPAPQKVQPPRETLDKVPSYNPRKDPPIVKEGTYRSHTVLTLEDGSIVIETTAGWKRFRTVRDYDRLMPA